MLKNTLKLKERLYFSQKCCKMSTIVVLLLLPLLTEKPIYYLWTNLLILTAR